MVPVTTRVNHDAYNASDSPTHVHAKKDLEEYVCPLIEEHAALLLTPGTVLGLDVILTPSGTGVTVWPGIAISKSGRVAILREGGKVQTGIDPAQGAPTLTMGDVPKEGVSLPTPKREPGDWDVVIEAREVSPQMEGEGRFNLEHAPWLRLRKSKDLIDPHVVVLASITLGNDGEVIPGKIQTRQVAGLKAKSLRILPFDASLEKPWYWQIQEANENLVLNRSDRTGVSVTVTPQGIKEVLDLGTELNDLKKKLDKEVGDRKIGDNEQGVILGGFDRQLSGLERKIAQLRQELASLAQTIQNVKRETDDQVEQIKKHEIPTAFEKALNDPANPWCIRFADMDGRMGDLKSAVVDFHQFQDGLKQSGGNVDDILKQYRQWDQYKQQWQKPNASTIDWSKWFNQLGS